MSITSTVTTYTTMSTVSLLKITTLLSIISMGRTVPVTPRWLRPCDSRNSITIATELMSPGQPLTLIPVTEHLDSVITLLRSSTQELRQLLDDYQIRLNHINLTNHNDSRKLLDKIRRRFSGSNEVVRSTEGWHMDGLPNIGNEITEDMELEAFLRQSYEHYVRIIVFMEEAIVDEVAYEAPYHTSLHEIYERYVQRHAYDVLCHLHVMGNQHDLDLSVTVTNSVMSESLRDIEARENRHKRDYVVIREFHKLALHSMKSLSLYRKNLS